LKNHFYLKKETPSIFSIVAHDASLIVHQPTLLQKSIHSSLQIDQFLPPQPVYFLKKCLKRGLSNFAEIYWLAPFVNSTGEIEISMEFDDLIAKNSKKCSILCR
jgi:hypothetical protein